MKNKKASLFLIVFLLVIFLPLTIVGFLFRGNAGLFNSNPDHIFDYKGYLWFYDNNSNLLSKYECKTEKCEIAKSVIEDYKYDINYYKDGVIKNDWNKNDRYIFIADGIIIYLYDINSGVTLQSYKQINNYNILDNLYIVKNNDDKWGVLFIENMPNLVLPFDYDFISVNKELNTSRYIVLKNGEWYLVNEKDEVITGKYLNPIIDYNSKYIFTKDNDKIRIFSYNNEEYLSELNILDYSIFNNYVGILTNGYILIYDNLSNNYLKIIRTNTVNEKLNIILDDNELNVMLGDNLVDSIELD